MRIGILFGGPSREREISFAGGRTVYDNLDKGLFEPVPIFIDSLRNFILLDWPYIYKGTIRDFYPPAQFVPKSEHGFQMYAESVASSSESTNHRIDRMIAAIGKRISITDLPNLIDVAFLTLHGEYGEDGQIQKELEALGIPYTGSGVDASAMGMNKAKQKLMMKEAGWPVPKFSIITRHEWQTGENLTTPTNFPVIVKPANQGSSIGASRVDNESDLRPALDRAFFARRLNAGEWTSLNESQRVVLIRELTDIREGIGLPVQVKENGKVEGEAIHHPDELLTYLNEHLRGNESIILESAFPETEVIIEEFIEGKEFSCIVIRNENADGTLGDPVALPPTEIRKGGEVYDYRSKYLAGLSRKITPIDLPDDQIEAIRRGCEKLFLFFGFHVYARIDGFIKSDGTIYLNDPNTTSGMLPSSFFFHQAAEIGLNPSQFLTYIIRTSLAERSQEQGESMPVRQAGGKKGRSSLSPYPLPLTPEHLLASLDSLLKSKQKEAPDKIKVAVVLGGYSSERHISVESGRNVYEKLSASTTYSPVPIFLKGNSDGYKLWQIPVNMLLKDNADDISDKVAHYGSIPIIESIKKQCEVVTKKYSSPGYTFEPREITLRRLADEVDFVFIALHGRPGEDGALQRVLESYSIPYNGSGPGSSQITIDKYVTNQMLAENGFRVAHQLVVAKDEYERDDETIENIEHDFGYPLIAKPVDDGCSSAVKRITNREELNAFVRTIFRASEDIGPEEAAILKLKLREEFPIKERMLIESLIERGGASHFLEVTGGMLISPGEESRFEVFEPSETLAGNEVLSLEEKFLAGEGQNITPARFSADPEANKRISTKVKEELRRAADILGVEGYCRIDAFVRIFDDERVETIIIEVNSLPGMTPATVIFHQAAINHYKPLDFIDRIIHFGLERSKMHDLRIATLD